VENNQLTVFEDKRYACDAHGNLVDKKIARHTHMTLAWNAAHQLTK
jgi:YD repeat-containing protein